MTSLVSATNSVITGNWIGSTLIADETYTITATLKDTSGVDIGVGGRTLTIEINNECSIDVGFACTTIPGVDTSITSVILGTMTDQGDGTYTYTFSVPYSGAISAVVMVDKAAGVYGEYYDNHAWSGTPVYDLVSPNIDFNWGNGDITPGYVDNVTAKFTTTLIPPTTDTYTLSIRHDDGVRINIGGTEWFDRIGDQ